MTKNGSTVSFRFSNKKTESERIDQRQKLLRKITQPDKKERYHDLFDMGFDQETVGLKNCENLVGSVEVPVGVAGPVLIRESSFQPLLSFSQANQSKKVSASIPSLESPKPFSPSLESLGFEDNEVIVLPLATTEGALVASVSRGCKAICQAGGVSLFVKKIGMTRAPVFELPTGNTAVMFEKWLYQHLEKIQQAAEKSSNHLKFISINTWIRGRYVFVRFTFDTDQAMGMNMVSIAVRCVWDQVISTYKNIKMVSVSSNMCTDKKDSFINKINGRGYEVHAEVLLPEEVLSQVLAVNSDLLLQTHIVKNLIGSNLAGSNSQNMHAANMIAAIFLATGQDMAHVGEASQVTTLVEKTNTGVLFSVTLPDVPVGVIGGGTWLSAQKQVRSLVRKSGSLTAEQLAGVVGVACLAGEVSGLAALSTGSLVSAHQKLAR